MKLLNTQGGNGFVLRFFLMGRVGHKSSGHRPKCYDCFRANYEEVVQLFCLRG